jgi:hypothetical protein
VPAEVAACGRPGEEGFKLETQIRRVLSAWQSELPRLLVFDNCEDETLLTKWRPPTGASRVLVTSRRQRWDPSLSVDALPLGVLDRQESISLIRKLAPTIDEAAAAAIAQELGDLPLALHLAGSFLNRYGDGVAPRTYLQQLQDQTLLEHDSLKGRGLRVSPTEHELQVAKTFALSYDRLNPEDETESIALALLARAACFAPGAPIPKALLFKTLDNENRPIDPLDLQDGLSRLLDVGLLESEKEGALVLHRLLAVYVKNVSVKDTNAPSDVETALLDEANRINNSGLPAGLIVWQPHLRFVTDQAIKKKTKQALLFAIRLGFICVQSAIMTARGPIMTRPLRSQGRSWARNIRLRHKV